MSPCERVTRIITMSETTQATVQASPDFWEKLKAKLKRANKGEGPKNCSSVCGEAEESEEVTPLSTCVEATYEVDIDRAPAASDVTAVLIRGVFFLVAVLLGWLLVELPWNENPFSLSSSHIFANLGIVALAGSVLFFVGQRSRAAMAVLVGLCLLVGVANFYVNEFKGQPILPADLFALSTAASVSGGYHLFLTWRLVGCLGAFAFYCFALWRWCPKRAITKSDVVVNVIAALLLAVMGAHLYQSTDIKQEHNVKVDVWDVRGSYATQGTLLCFLSRAQELVPHEPAGYSDEVVADILAPYQVVKMQDSPDGVGIGSASKSPYESRGGGVGGVGEGVVKEPDEGSGPGGLISSESPDGFATAVNPASSVSPDGSDSPDSASPGSPSIASGTPSSTAFDGPNVVVVMNETFSDLSSYPGLQGTNAQPEFLKEVQADSLVAGDVYTSAMGGGTCNSEFEFLTGTTMGLLGAGVYPYVLYDLDGVENLASHFRSLGYDTAAIHPAEATNWRRDVIYAQLGFDSFDDITTMEDADTFRNLVTDKATYERVLEKIESGDDPQFIFDVTIQNHGGYTTGLVPREERVHLDSDLVESVEVDEFLATIKRSDEDLRWFVEALNASAEPTVLVFFGDHQPGFADDLFEATFDISVDEATAKQTQARYHTPFFIWANEAAREAYNLSPADDDATQMTTSLNYLGALLLEAAELPQTTYATYLNALRSDLPVVNLNGYQDSDERWHWFGETPKTKSQSLADQALDGYEIVQYDLLFNRNR